MDQGDLPNPDPAAGDAEPLDALRRLEQRLDRASDAAERLIAEATARAAGAVAGGAAGGQGAAGGPRAAGGSGASSAQRPPPAGWQTPGGHQHSDSELLVQVINSLRELIPPELERRLAEAFRELLLALRALIDWYLERAERRRADPVEVQDIPIS